MSIQDPGQRMTGWNVAGDHERRIRALEALEDCCADTCSTFDETVATIASTQTLLGYWRAGEPSGDLLDTSGYNGDGLGAADATLQTGTNPIIRDVTGCLPAFQDDGAIEGTDPTGADGDFFRIPLKGGRYELKSQNFSLAAWMNPTALIAGKNFSGVLTNMSVSTAAFGWGIGVTNTGTVMFRRETVASPAVVRLESSALPVGDCHFVVATYDTVEGHKLYIDATLVATDTQTFNVTESTNTTPLIGAGITIGVTPVGSYFYGVMDELSIWGDALTEDSIVTLFHSSTCDGESVPPTFVVYQDGS